MEYYYIIFCKMDTYKPRSLKTMFDSIKHTRFFENIEKVLPINDIFVMMFSEFIDEEFTEVNIKSKVNNFIAGFRKYGSGIIGIDYKKENLYYLSIIAEPLYLYLCEINGIHQEFKVHIG